MRMKADSIWKLVNMFSESSERSGQVCIEKVAVVLAKQLPIPNIGRRHKHSSKPGRIIVDFSTIIS